MDKIVHKINNQSDIIMFAKMQTSLSGQEEQNNKDVFKKSTNPRSFTDIKIRLHSLCKSIAERDYIYNTKAANTLIQIPHNI